MYTNNLKKTSLFNKYKILNEINLGSDQIIQHKIH